MIRIRLRVKEVATEKGVSMSRLSHLTFLAMSTVQSIYRDPFRPVSTETLQRIANALEVSVHNLLEEVPDEKEKEPID
jgi:DNA-binding Xre family transcriptional regulator